MGSRILIEFGFEKLDRLRIPDQVFEWLDGLLMMLDHDLRLATFIHSYIEMAIKYFEPYSNPRYGVLTSNGQWRAERNRNRKFWVVCVP